MPEQQNILPDQALLSSKEKKLQDLIHELESVPGKTNEDEAFDFSNDGKVRSFIPDIVKFVKKSTAPLKVAIIVSHGALWSLAKELEGIDLFVRIDMNKRQLERDRQRKIEILYAKNTNALLPKPNKKVDANDIFAMKRERERLKAPGIEIESYADYHYLSSENSLGKAQAFLRRNNIAFVGGNLTDPIFMKKIGAILRKYQAQVTFTDLTNVMGWIGGNRNQEKKSILLSSLSNLPIQENFPILHSAHMGLAGRSPLISQLSYGLEEYEKDAAQAGLRY